MLGIRTVPLLGMIGGAVAVWVIVAELILRFGDPAWLDFLVHKVLFGALAALIVLELYTVIFHGGVPNLTTAPAVRKEIISLLKRDKESRQSTRYKIVDLGSGSGKLTREIARAMPDATVVGIDLSPQSVFLSRLKQRRSGLKNLSYLRMSLFDYDLSDVDAVIIFQLPALLNKVGPKLRRETTSGTLIMSNKFPLKGWGPQQVMQIKTLYLNQGTLYIYRQTDA